MRRTTSRPDETIPVRVEHKSEPPKHKPFREFPVATLDDLVKQLETGGQAIDILTIEGVPHLVCGKPFANIFVQADPARHFPGDLLAIYQYCRGCKIAVRVL
ncbi:MAG TPA: hypothetical protein VFE96_01910 [Candidatus Bathyarchaeia archaeon]|nr:hypothetical protein [Candidatus Bathyarchaeia archaeon]